MELESVCRYLMLSPRSFKKDGEILGQQEIVASALVALAFGSACRDQEERIAAIGQEAVLIVATSLWFVGGHPAPEEVARVLPSELQSALRTARDPAAVEVRRSLARLALKLGKFPESGALLPALLCMPCQEWIDRTADPKFVPDRGVVPFDSAPGFNAALFLVRRIGADGLDPLLRRMRVATGLELQMACELVRSTGVLFAQQRPDLPTRIIECLDRATFVKRDVDWLGQALAGTGTAGAAALEIAKSDARPIVRLGAQRIARVLFSKLRPANPMDNAGQLRLIDVGEREDDGDAGVLAAC